MRWPRRSKQASGTNRRSGSTAGGRFERLGNAHAAESVGSPGRQRRKVEMRARGRRPPAAPSRSRRRSARRAARACRAPRGSDERRTRPTAPRAARAARPSLARRSVSRRGRLRAEPLRRASASWRRIAFGIGVGRSHSVIADSRSRRARSREGRWTVIPGAYVSRWAPCAKAHGLGQGQLP